MEIKNTARTVLKKAIIFSLLFAGVTCAYSQILDKNALLKKKAELSEQIKEQEANRDTLLKQQRQLSQQMREIGQAGNGKAAGGKRRYISEKQSVMRLMKELESAFDNIGENSSIADLKGAVEKISKFDISTCPAEVGEKFKAFVDSMKTHLDELGKIFNEIKLDDKQALKKTLETYAKDNPEIAERLEKCLCNIAKGGFRLLDGASPVLCKIKICRL